MKLTIPSTSFWNTYKASSLMNCSRATKKYSPEKSSRSSRTSSEHSATCPNWESYTEISNPRTSCSGRKTALISPSAISDSPLTQMKRNTCSWGAELPALLHHRSSTSKTWTRKVTQSAMSSPLASSSTTFSLGILCLKGKSITKSSTKTELAI